jgi:pimeloyl-ACP methyl ester carboxylesterase
MPQSAFGDLVVLLPGFVGSRLVRGKGKDAVTIWDLSMSRLPRLLREIYKGGLVLPGDGIDPPDDEVEAVDLFSSQLLPGFMGVDDYQSILSALQRSAGPEQVLTFPYDWRLSNRHAAKRLETKAMDALWQWRIKSGNDDAKLWLVCHSMGGLVARYFCEHFGGREHTRAVITIGTPHRGAVKALGALVNGIRYGPLDLSPMLRSLPSVYELLPLYPVVREEHGPTLHIHRIAELFGLDSITGEEVRMPDTAPLPAIDRAKLRRALEFHRDIRVPAQAREDQGQASPYLQYAFFNRRQRTPLSARFNGAGVDLLETYPRLEGDGWREDDDRGDGTVPSFASVPIEWADSGQAIAIGEKHTEMQSVVTVQDTILNWLRPLDVRAMRGGPASNADVIALEVPPTLMVGEDLIVSASAIRPMNTFIDLTGVESNTRTTQRLTLPGDDTIRMAPFRGLASGTYRVTARPENPMKPAVSDYVFVIDPREV